MASYVLSSKNTPVVFPYQMVCSQVYNSSNNELVRTNTLVKGAIIQIDATPFRQWYEAHVSTLLLAPILTLKAELVSY